MSNVTTIKFADDGAIIIADSIATLPTEDNLYRHSKLFNLGGSVVGFIGSSYDAEAVIEECRKEYSQAPVSELSQRIKDSANRRRKEGFIELYLTPRNLSFEQMDEHDYEDYVNNQFFEATFVLAGLDSDGVGIYIIQRPSGDNGSPAYLAIESEDFLSYGCGDDVVTNVICNYINRRGYPIEKTETYRLLLEAFDKINIRGHISRPYDAYIAEGRLVRNIPRELNELNAKLLRMVDEGILDRSLLDKSLKMTVEYEQQDSVFQSVLQDVVGRERDLLSYLFKTRF